jgi:hypothetical protein
MVICFFALWSLILWLCFLLYGLLFYDYAFCFMVSYFMVMFLLYGFLFYGYVFCFMVSYFMVMFFALWSLILWLCFVLYCLLFPESMYFPDNVLFKRGS